MKPKHVPDEAAPSTSTTINEGYLTPKQMGDIIQVTPQTINNWHRDQIIPASIEVESTIRYNRAQVFEALADRKAAKSSTHRISTKEPLSNAGQSAQGAGTSEIPTDQQLDINNDSVLAAVTKCLPEIIQVLTKNLSMIETVPSAYWTTGSLG